MVKTGDREYRHKGWIIVYDYDCWYVYVENDDEEDGEDFHTLKAAQAHVRMKTKDDKRLGKEVRDLWRAAYGRKRSRRAKKS